MANLRSSSVALRDQDMTFAQAGRQQMWRFLGSLSLSLSLLGCAPTASVPGRPAFLELLHEAKFVAHGEFTGADTPEDQKPLKAAVDSAIEDIRVMPDPLGPVVIRRRLSKLIADTNLYATEDRDEVGRYAVRIWRAAGFTEESGLYPVSDEQVLARPLSRLRSRPPAS